MAEQFHASAQPTLGVEWELAIADPETRDLVGVASTVIEAAKQLDSTLQLEREFLANTVEIVTPVCTTVPEAMEQLRRGYRVLDTAAREQGFRLWSSGSHPFADFRKQEVSDKGSYKEIIERTQYWGNQMLIWGLHVHVGVSHRDRVWPIIRGLCVYYPHLLALTASSPGWEGTDTGYASNRSMLYQQLPTAGLPYQFSTWQEWESFMADQSKSGVINHTGSMHFDIRPAGKWGTVEVRIADAGPDLDGIEACTALTHCLVVHFDRMIDRGAMPPSLQPWHVAENKWRAARYGLDALVVTSQETDEAWVTDELRDLVEQLAPIARELGCEASLRKVENILERGAPYQRQRTLFERTGSWVAAVDQAMAELEATVEGHSFPGCG